RLSGVDAPRVPAGRASPRADRRRPRAIRGARASLRGARPPGRGGPLSGRGVGLVSLTRAGQEIPFNADTEVDRGDILRITGSKADVERAGRALGYVDRPSSETDVVFVGIGIFIGGLLGATAVNV